MWIVSWFASGRSHATKLATLIEFKEHCKELLINAGWQAQTTAGSGDQVVDVVFEAVRELSMIWDDNYPAR